MHITQRQGLKEYYSTTTGHGAPNTHLTKHILISLINIRNVLRCDTSMVVQQDTSVVVQQDVSVVMRRQNGCAPRAWAESSVQQMSGDLLVTTIATIATIATRAPVRLVWARAAVHHRSQSTC